MRAKFCCLEDGNEVLCLAKDDFSSIVVAEPENVWAGGTYGIVMCRRDGKSSLVLPFVKALDLGVRAIGAPMGSDGAAIDLNDIPADFADSDTLLGIIVARYGQNFADAVRAKFLRVYDALARADIAECNVSTAFAASPWMMDNFAAIVLSCESVPDSIKEGFRTGAHPTNHWVEDSVVESLLEYCGYFDHSDLLKILVREYFEG